MKSDTELEIKKRVISIATSERQSVCNKIQLGRIAISLQQLNDDRDANGRVSYKNARRKILHWMGAVPEMSEKTLETCIYIALRASSAQIKILADAGASVSAIYASVQACDKKGGSAWTDYVADVKAGKAKVGKHLMCKINGWESQKKKKKDAEERHVSDAVHDPEVLNIKIMDCGQLSREHIMRGLLTLQTLVKQDLLVEEMNNAVQEGRKKGNELKKWRLLAH